MKTPFLLVAFGLTSLFGPFAMTAETRLAWDNCVAGGGTQLRTFACNTNVGDHTLVASVIAPAGITSWDGFETRR